MCEVKRSEPSKVSDRDKEYDCDRESDNHSDDNSDKNHKQHQETSINPSSHTELISHPYQPFNKCFTNSRVLIAHYADCTLVN